MKIVFTVPEDDRVHYCELEKLCFVGVYDVSSSTFQYYSLSLVDQVIQDTPVFNKDEILFCTDKKLFDRFFLSCNTYDINTQFWLLYNKELFHWQDSSYYKIFKKLYYNISNWCRFIPYVKYVEIFKDLIDTVIKFPEIYSITQSSLFYSQKVYKSICGVENAGIAVSLTKFNTHFKKKYASDIVRCLYKLHTTTGRPSNSFDGINYSGLNKKDGSRSPFISRFKENGVLLEFDLDAYHIRLIAQIINYPLPDTSVHEYFGRKYFKVNELTEEEYSRSKGISFHILYGGLTEEYAHIEFFQKVEDLKASIWKEFNTVNKLVSPLSGKILTSHMFPDMNKSKLFNYLLQTVETEYSILFIEEILNILHNKSSKLVLYTYDSFLVDFNINDGKETVLDIVTTLKNCKVKIGTNYNDLKPYNIAT